MIAKKNIMRLMVLALGLAAFSRAAMADRKAADEKTGNVADGAVDVENSSEEVEEIVEAMPENTLDTCQDKLDNDLDSHVDCDDQDCEIFAACVADEPVEEKQPEKPGAPITRVTVFETKTLEETGRYCKDGIDNDNNGLADCQESQCQHSLHCRKEMYDYERDETRPPGFFTSFGLGLAAPNFRHPHATTDSTYGNDISFDPDVGGMFDLQAGFMFHKFVGAGVNVKLAVTGASNQEDKWFNDDDDDYKFLGLKLWNNFGGFVRLQWPFERVVPYINLHAGMSTTRHRWRVYDDENTWDDIYDYEDDDDDDFLIGRPDKKRSKTMRHFTFAVEPGFHAYVIKQVFGLGVKAWLPVVASSDSETDNVGIMMDFIFTPQWRGPKVLKEKYRNPEPAVTPKAEETAYPGAQSGANPT